ncbi:MAG: outer membrane beta-barrel protein [Bacteroidales bacterium]|nr:outer membrane beta-barrel protein [Bacteroidales bacterium]
MKIFGNILIFFLCAVSVFGQGNISLSGTILDKTEEAPIIGGTVELLNPKDSTVITGAISDVNGIFSMPNLSSGKYILKFSYLGFNELTQNLSLSGNRPAMNVGKVYLEPNTILLSEAVIDGKKPEVIVKNDTIEYDAASYKVTENAVVEDLLKRLPGVEVDTDGKITVNGKEVKKFLIEDKEFFSDDPQVASKNLPAEMVEKLQVVDRKSETARLTGFDDGEEETIINLTVKPGMKKGTMGNAFVGAGTDLADDNDVRYRGAGFLNRMQGNDRYTVIAGINNNNNMGAGDLGAQQFGGMRTRRGSGGITETTNLMVSMDKELWSNATLNGDIRYTGLDRLSRTITEEATLSEERSQLDKSNSMNNYLSDAISTNFRFEWKPDTLNTLIVRPNFSYNKSKSFETSTLYRSNFDTGNMILDEYQSAKAKGEGYRFGGNLEYAHKFAKPGRVFSLSLRGNYNDSYSYENNFNRSIRFSDDNEETETIQNRRDENDNTSNSLRGTVTWVEPLGNSNFIQGSYRISYTDTKNINSTYDLWRDLEDYDPLLVNSLLANDSIATLVLDQSRSTLRDALEQRISVSFKAIREKYNYTIGFNIDPSNSLNETYQPFASQIEPITYMYDRRLPNVMGDSLFYSVEQNVVNFSPVINFNYLLGPRSNIRIDYEGETNQPSANQLRDYIDMSRPNNWVEGNPNLKPSYRNSLRARFMKYITESQLSYNISVNGDFSTNDIVSVMVLLDDGVRLTQYKNVNGNWNVSARGGFNMPLRNKKFTIGSFSSLSYRNQKSYVNSNENTMKNFQGRISANANYRSDLFDIGIRANFNYNDIHYTIQPEKNQQTYNYGVGGFTTWYLPYNWVIESDINWTDRAGYASGFNIPEVMWNASVTKQIFNNTNGTGSLKFDIYDILQDRNSISASYTDNGYKTTDSNAIPSYFMCSFIYKFTFFPKSSGSGNSEGEPRRGPGEGGGRRGGPPMF